ncbi:hypothetical protein N7530_010306 [Penicillium desertorum]|uniref:Uncharacterized protein n=1 Tax=Penicillium desertorum TaxID=1303715 RepID=A0A9W9WK44_9EURO|nr:hypothetical protein N7530_010306 [Penicillium desertorum]
MADCDECDHSKLVPQSKRKADDIVINYGAIASENQVMRHGVTRDNVARELDAACFGMESVGLMDILPCLPIRGICDSSDSHKNKEWKDMPQQLRPHMPGSGCCISGYKWEYDG